MTFEDENGVSSGLIKLHFDELDTVWTQQYHNFNYIIISGGKWYLKSALYDENKTIVGCQNCHDQNITQLGFKYAYRKPPLCNARRNFGEHYKWICIAFEKRAQNFPCSCVNSSSQAKVHTNVSSADVLLHHTVRGKGL